MGATTRWKDTCAESFEEVIRKMTSQISNDERTSSVYRINYSTRKVLEQDGYFSFNGESIRFNMVRFGFDQVTAQENPSDDRVIRKNGFIIIYEQRGSIYYIVDQNTKAKNILRKFLGYNGRNEIEDSKFDFREDFFVWLVSRVYNSAEPIENDYDGAIKELQLEEIKGIRGNTEDLQTKVATSGESVMNVISTLSFLLESRRLNQVVLTLRYTGHDNIGVKLQKNTVELERPYVGEYDELSQDEMIAKIYLLLYLEILPLLEQEYRMNMAENEWNQDTYIEFLTAIKDTVIEKIESKINSLSQ